MRTISSAILLWMMASGAAWCETGAIPPPPPPAAPPTAEILGLHIGMPQEEVEGRLRKLGELVERKAEQEGKNLEMKQLWNLRDARFASLIARFDSHHKLKWITAYTREGAPALLYSDVGDVSLASVAGRYIYTWKLAAEGGRPASVLTARGTSAERFSSVSLVAAPLPRASAIPDSLLR